MFKYLLLLLLFLLAGCMEDSAKPLMVTATGDSLATAVNLATSAPTADTTVNVHRQDSTATAQPPLITCFASEQPVTRYEVEAVLNWETKIVKVAEKVSYVNLHPVVLETLLFQVEPNRQPNIFYLQGVSVIEGQNIDEVRLAGNRMSVPLPEPLPENCQITLQITFELHLPAIADGYTNGRLGYFGYTARQINLGHWFPTVGIYRQGLEWYTPAPSPFGEQTLTETSDFNVLLKVENAPEGMNIAGPGMMHFSGGHTWEFTLNQARDLALSVGVNFQHISQMTDTGKIVEVYYFLDNGQNSTSPNHALLSTVQAMALYEELFGVTFPYSRLVVVEGDFPDGMEFSGLVFVSEAWFRAWNGRENDWLTLITVHEVAHQWWYVLIGNDPAAYPYLDEAFATYSEFLFFERYYPERADWWWDFRVNRYALDGAVDSNVYQYSEARPYINAVYLRGAQMLHTTRQQLGDDLFFEWLMSYASTYQHQIATPRDLWGKLPPEHYLQTESIRQQFFQTWDMVKN